MAAQDWNGQYEIQGQVLKKGTVSIVALYVRLVSLSLEIPRNHTTILSLLPDFTALLFVLCLDFPQVHPKPGSASLTQSAQLPFIGSTRNVSRPKSSY
ncbi:hypothetical protein Tco_1092806 [Tanacetum coccineum]|uniref:Uncharacterized protein n=1 Tax=Tanacetum coccineum TaxID=301880 RepID=A0ABQ5IB12_9ASTR